MKTITSGKRSHLYYISILILAVFLILAIMKMATINFVYAQNAIWSEPQNLFETTGRASEVEIVADSSGMVHAFWAYAVPGNEASGSGQAIYYARQEDGAWSEPVDILVSPGGRVARMQNIVVDGDGYLHIVWSGGNALFYSRSYALEAGSAAGWSQPFALTSGVSALEPAIAVGLENELYVLWTQAGAGLIFARSEDGGESWSAPQAIFPASQDNELARWGRIAVDGRGRLHVVLTYTINDPAAVYGRIDANLLYYLRSDDSGSSWNEPFLVTPEPDFGEINVTTFGEDVVHLVWNGRAGRHGRYHRWSEDGGDTWSVVQEIIAPAPANPIGNGGLTGFPALVVDATGKLHMATTANQGNFYLNWQGGSDWSTPILISPGLDGRGITGQSSSLEQPSITVNEGNQLHVVFHDGFERIWHTQSITDAPYKTPAPLPMLDSVIQIEAATPSPVETAPTGSPLLDFSLDPPPASGQSAYSPLLASLLPVAILLVMVIFLYVSRSRR